MIKEKGGLQMLFLFVFVLLLVSVILVDYIIREAKVRFRDFRQTRRILNEHPEMKGVDPEEEGLLAFGIDEELAAYIMDNDEPGEDMPFGIAVPDVWD
jgi:hypothetical protein